MASDPFFDRELAQSQIKAQIVRKYLWAWAKNMIKYGSKRHERFAYSDLFAGPGYYEQTGTPSTPLLVLQRIIADPKISEWVVPVFNDAKQAHIDKLKQAIAELPGAQDLRHQPIYQCSVVDDAFVPAVDSSLVPTFTFIDPYGYKDLVSREFIVASIRNWGCDTLIFFNYFAINRAITNPVLCDGLVPLFGATRFAQLQAKVPTMAPAVRESAVMAEFSAALEDLGVEFPLPFRIRHRNMNRTSHYLVFLSKKPLAHHLMKDVMAGASSPSAGAVPTYEFTNRAPKPVPSHQQLGLVMATETEEVMPLFDIEPVIGSLAHLKASLLREFFGRTLTVFDLYMKHQYGTPYYLPNYKAVLLDLEREEKVYIDPPAAKRPQRHGRPTLADDKQVTFLARE